jgi:hypothetical protein
LGIGAWGDVIGKLGPTTVENLPTISQIEDAKSKRTAEHDPSSQTLRTLLHLGGELPLGRRGETPLTGEHGQVMAGCLGQGGNG